MKNKLILTIGLACALALLTGCNTYTRELSPQELAAAKYPAKPTAWKQQAEGLLKYTLKDYDSAKFENWMLLRAYCPGNPSIFGHAVTVNVNAKNSYGGYTGFQPYVFFIKPDGVIINAQSLMNLNMMHLAEIVEP